MRTDLPLAAAAVVLALLALLIPYLAVKLFLLAVIGAGLVVVVLVR
jgi:hypothetical protein